MQGKKLPQRIISKLIHKHLLGFSEIIRICLIVSHQEVKNQGSKDIII